MDLQFLGPIVLTLAFSFLAALFHYKSYFKRDIAFATVTFSLAIFCIVYFVSFENNLGLGIGLIGILTLIQLRSTPENLIDIGFIFYSITIGLLNSSVPNMLTITIVNTFLLLVVLLFSSRLFFQKNVIKTEITFDDLQSEKLDKSDVLLKRIEEKFGVTPLRFKVREINYLKDSITVEIIYNGPNSL